MSHKEDNNTNKEQHKAADQEVNETEEIKVPRQESGEETDPCEKTAQELAELKDKYLRKVAEFDNYQRRTAKEKNELRQTAGKEVIIDLLDVLDDINRATAQIEKSDDIAQIKEGVTLIFNKFKHILKNKGLTEMESRNEEFNPDLHEAITEIPAPTEALSGKVVDEVQKGYYLNGNLIRHAKVVVGK